MEQPGISSRARLLAPALLACAAAFIFFARLGERGFENKDTVWYVEIAWEMLRSGDWVVPRFNTVIFTEKPALFIWLVAACARCAGGLTPFVARLPSAFAALGCTFLTVSLGSRIFNRRAGLLAGFILCTNYAFAWEARTCMVDMVFTFFVTLALCLFHRGIASSAAPGACFIAAYAAAGLAGLTKGPLGVALPAAVVLLYLAWRRELGMLRRMRIATGLLMVLGMQAAWYLPYLLRIGPEGRRFFLEMYVYKENLLRFATGFDHYEPFWFYAPAVFLRFLPWSPFLLLIPLLPPPATGDRRFPASWFLGIFALLTLSTGKHSRYALPLYPAAALLVADFWDRLAAAEGRRVARFLPPAAAVLALAAAAGLPVAAHNLAPALFPSSFALAAALAAAACATFRAPAGEKPWLAFASIAAGFVFAWNIYLAGFGAHELRRAEHQRLARELAPALGKRQLATYGLFSRRLALGFFLGRPVIYIDRERALSDYLQSQACGFILMESAEYANSRSRLPAGVSPVGQYRYRNIPLVLLEKR